MKRRKKSREVGRGEKMSDGHSDAGAGEERETDSGDMTDDGEVELNLPREDAVEWDPPGEDVRDLPGTTASGTSVTNQEELYRLEPPKVARPKWARPGWPLPVIKERDESYGPNVATSSAGPTECRGSDAHADGRRQTWGLPGPGGTAAWQGDTISFSRFC